MHSLLKEEAALKLSKMKILTPKFAIYLQGVGTSDSKVVW